MNMQTTATKQKNMSRAEEYFRYPDEKSTLLTYPSLDVSEHISISLEPQEEGGFVALCKEYPGAVGQGETEDEAVKDLIEAIKVLKEYLEMRKK